MTASHVWVVTRLLPFGVPTVSRYALVRRLPAGGAVVQVYGGRRQIRPTADVSLHATEANAMVAVAAQVGRVRLRLADEQLRLDRANHVHDVPAEGYTGPLKITEDML